MYVSTIHATLVAFGRVGLQPHLARPMWAAARAVADSLNLNPWTCLIITTAVATGAGAMGDAAEVTKAGGRILPMEELLTACREGTC